MSPPTPQLLRAVGWNNGGVDVHLVNLSTLFLCRKYTSHGQGGSGRVPREIYGLVVLKRISLVNPIMLRSLSAWFSAHCHSTGIAGSHVM